VKVMDRSPRRRDETPPTSERHILQFPRPGPIWEIGQVYRFRGHLIQVVGERWRAEDAHLAPVPTEPDSQRPGVALACYARDVETGEVILPVSGEELSSAAPQPPRRAGDSAGRSAGLSAG
jgi:hypothetical protein